MNEYFIVYQEDELHVYNVLDFSDENKDYDGYLKLLNLGQDRFVYHDKIMDSVDVWTVYAIVKASNPLAAVYKYLNGRELGVDL